MNALTRLRMQPDDYLAWEAAQERKHELVDGIVTLMAGASVAHLDICGNVYAALRQRLKGTPCRPLVSELKVRTGPRSFRYPDVTVDCGNPNPADHFADQPTVLVEVSSPSTEALDEITKLEEYKALESVRHVVLLAQSRPAGRVWARTDGGWTTQDAEGLKDALALPHLQLTLPLAEVYEGVAFPPAPEAEA